MEYEANGIHARFERFMADMLFYVAGGSHIDMERTGRFSDQLETFYANPFQVSNVKQTAEMSAEEIKQYILGKIRELRKKLED